MEEKKWGDTKPFIPKRPRKWDIKDITIKLDNLKKRFGAWTIESEIAYQRQYTDNAVDYLNMAYYALKQRYCRIHMWRYGVINNVDYLPKQNVWYSYNWNDNNYTWTITSNTQTSSVYYATYFNTL
jgi:hypothetical protein